MDHIAAFRATAAETGAFPTSLINVEAPVFGVDPIYSLIAEKYHSMVVLGCGCKRQFVLQPPPLKAIDAALGGCAFDACAVLSDEKTASCAAGIAARSF